MPNGWRWRDESDQSTFGRTNRPDELLHLIMDVLERENL
jgi:hypothetical protein